MATIKKVLCALDFSEISPKVADYTATIAQQFGAEIVALYAAPSLAQYVGFHVPPNSIDSFVGEIVAGAEKTMEDFLKEHFKGAPVRGRVVTGYAAEEILNIAVEEKVDLIIMGTHGRKGIDLILFGSVAEKVVKSSSIPVLTIRPSEPEA
ncbi:universal stress protein [Megalodesulfovibrio paquesii]